jgi:hypothetical protein
MHLFMVCLLLSLLVFYYFSYYFRYGTALYTVNTPIYPKLNLKPRKTPRDIIRTEVYTLVAGMQGKTYCGECKSAHIPNSFKRRCCTVLTHWGLGNHTHSIDTQQHSLALEPVLELELGRILHSWW